MPIAPHGLLQRVGRTNKLDSMLRRFFRNRTKGFRLDRESRALTLSWIMKKDGHLFSQMVDGVLGFVKRRLDDETSRWLSQNQVIVRYFRHDWTFNDIAQADSR